jgi:hypothetical protein
LSPDTAETTGVSRKFGWFIPKADGKVDLGLRSIPLSAEIWAEFAELIAVTVELRPFVIDYLSLETSYAALADIERDIAASIESMPNTFCFGGVQQTLVLAQAQGALSNFLAAASAFRDRAGTRLRERHGPASVQNRHLKAGIKSAYDASLPYRLLYNLRNYAQHHDSPLSMIPIHGERQISGEVEFTVSLVLKPKEMLRSKEIQKSFRAELSRQPDEIQLVPLVKAYFRLHGAIMKAVIGMHVPRLIELQRYGQVVLTKAGLPRGAVPMIWEGEAPPRPLRFYHFSFDELAFVQQLHNRLSELPPD